MYSDVAKILYTKEQIDKRVKELGKEISDKFRGEEVLMVCVLKGSSIFYADLVRAMDIPVEFDFIHVSSYGEGDTTSGKVTINKDLTVDIKGKNLVYKGEFVVLEFAADVLAYRLGIFAYKSNVKHCVASVYPVSPWRILFYILL